MSDPEVRSALRVAVHRIAIVAGVFCAVLAGLLWHNGIQLHRADESFRLVDSEKLVGLKQQLAADPGDADLKDRIRTLDQDLRLEYFRRQSFATRGGFTLLGGGLAFIVALHLARHLRGPRVPVFSAKPEDRMRSAQVAAKAVGGTLIVLTGLTAAMVGGRTRQWQAAPAVGGDLPEPAPTVNEAWWPEPEEWAAQWPCFRGPGGMGVATVDKLPAGWNGETGEGILWKTAIPLPGENSPVVWEDRIYLSGATEDERAIYGIDATTGRILWSAPVSTPQGSRFDPPAVMEETGFAAPTAVTDGRRVIAIFANGEIVGVGTDGSPLWARHLGEADNLYGHANSLAMWRDLVIVVYDRGGAEDGLSRILALDAATGETRWSTDRPVPASWVSPMVIEHEGQPQILTAANPWIIAYDPADGSELWKVKAMSGDVAPSPAYHDGVAYFTNTGACLIAVKVDGRGDVTDSHVLWKRDEDDYPDICSLLCDGPRVYTVVYGRLFAYDAQSGDQVWEHDLEDDFQASPVLVNGRLWLLTMEGETIIGDVDAEGFHEVARHPLGEEIGATPAFGPGRIYLRGREHLYAIGGDEG
ncbi:PQQ-binding-like beta-propeller repeat protein [Haloferula sp. A504]|uniref:outer membrane protein assembly factor BamB family protein n=1 Tax=Haloferula sp. A504 TaxID=3373601 RepID=UPI0031BD03C5|nr:PQQ-binding-like beta-propeller repeat protein [Verrucomicrobiaceae bacterium E54]